MVGSGIAEEVDVRFLESDDVIVCEFVAIQYGFLGG
jgi:hypothetical protein